MSSALLRKSLEIVDSDSKKGHKKKKSKGVFDLIPAAHTKVKAIGKGGKIERRAVYTIDNKNSRKNKGAFKDRDTKVEENLRKLNALSSSSLNKDTADKIIKRAKYGRPLIEIEEEKEDEGTVFTEEDFKNFEKDLS